MRECKHGNFDFSRTSGVGYVQCADCGKHIPIEQAVATLDSRIKRLEVAMDNVWRLVVTDREQVDGQ